MAQAAATHRFGMEGVFWDRLAEGVLGMGAQALTEEGGMYPFITDTLGASLWSGQREIVEAVERYPRTAVRSCHGIGKSFSVARIAVAFLQTHRNSIVLTTAPSSAQVKEVMWAYIRGAAEHARKPLLGKRGHPLYTKWEISANWKALGISPGKNNSGMQGFHAPDILVIVDEAAGVGEHIYEQIEGLMTGAGARLLLIGNPTNPDGSFRKAFHEARELYHTITISADKTPNFTAFGVTREDIEQGTWKEKVAGKRMPYPGLVDPAWAAAQVALNGADHPDVLSRVWAQFPEGGQFSLIRLSDIEAVERVGEDEVTRTGRVIAGIDVARHGKDETAIAIRQGEALLGTMAINGADSHEVYALFEELCDDLELDPAEIEIRVDVTGLGASVVDTFKGHSLNVKPVNFGGASSDPEQWKYAIHEYWWQLAERFRIDEFGRRRIGLVGWGWDELTKSQLSDIRYGFQDGRTKPTIERKAEAKKRGRKSPDRAEAVMLAFATLVPGAKTAPYGMKSLGGAVAKGATVNARHGAFRNPNKIGSRR